MSEENNSRRFFLQLDMGDVLDQEQLDQLTRQLRTEILSQDVEDVELVSADEVPEGAKSAQAITWGTLAIEVLPSFLPSVVEFLKSWTMREKSRKVKIHTQVGDKSVELEYSSMGIKNDELKELVSILSENLKSVPSEVRAEIKAEEVGTEDLKEDKIIESSEGEENIVDDVETEDLVDQAEDIIIGEEEVEEVEEIEKVEEEGEA